jgi:hypothetical protein
VRHFIFALRKRLRNETIDAQTRAHADELKAYVMSKAGEREPTVAAKRGIRLSMRCSTGSVRCRRMSDEKTPDHHPRRRRPARSGS